MPNLEEYEEISPVPEEEEEDKEDPIQEDASSDIYSVI